MADTARALRTTDSVEPLCQAVALASRRVPPRAPLAPTLEERAELARAADGLEAERWSLLEAARVALIAACPLLQGKDALPALEELFRYADVGEACAGYRALALLASPERFLWRAGEGARTNMRAVFEATCCDTPYPRRHFDDIAWRQALIKALFIGAPLQRIQGFEERRDEELARMALDLADERTSAGRPVPSDLWACLGRFGGARAQRALERELERGDAQSQRAVQQALEQR